MVLANLRATVRSRLAGQIKTLTAVLNIVGVSHITIPGLGIKRVNGRHVRHRMILGGGMPLIVWGCRSQLVVNPVKRWETSVIKLPLWIMDADPLWIMTQNVNVLLVKNFFVKSIKTQ